MLRLVQFLTVTLSVCTAAAQTTWRFNNLTNIGGHAVTVLGHPRVITTPHGPAVQFDGINDGLIVSNNPLAGWTNLTGELIFEQDRLTAPTARKPRIVLPAPKWCGQ